MRARRRAGGSTQFSVHHDKKSGNNTAKNAKCNEHTHVFSTGGGHAGALEVFGPNKKNKVPSVFCYGDDPGSGTGMPSGTSSPLALRRLSLAKRRHAPLLPLAFPNEDSRWCLISGYYHCVLVSDQYPWDAANIKFVFFIGVARPRLALASPSPIWPSRPSCFLPLRSCSRAGV